MSAGTYFFSNQSLRSSDEYSLHCYCKGSQAQQLAQYVRAGAYFGLMLHLVALPMLHLTGSR
jgi:hypothetical protein